MAEMNAVNNRVAHDLVSNAPSNVGGGDLANQGDFD